MADARGLQAVVHDADLLDRIMGIVYRARDVQAQVGVLDVCRWRRGEVR